MIDWSAVSAVLTTALLWAVVVGAIHDLRIPNPRVTAALLVSFFVAISVGFGMLASWLKGC